MPETQRRIALAREVDERSDEERQEVADYLRTRTESGGFGSLGDFFKKGREG